ncbi:uncharacterized mitochondrial protein AtMg00310-like [Coffea arabica]|uniref:Uncharacterized mitochondrial protein AtMg00310-like n=1 Tax=Coffea arabica TaxID=13443 RepID=A0ABM4WPM7_COFAR
MLTSGRHLMLIWHVLTAVPLHTFMILEPSKGVLSQIELFMSRFFWGEVDGCAKQHWRNWSALYFLPEQDGLGINELEDTVRAFGCKLWWKLRTGDTLWSWCMLSKYVIMEEHVTTVPARPSSSWVWKRLLKARDFMEDNMQTLIRDGSSYFWFDNWLGTGTWQMTRTESHCPKLELQTYLWGGQWHLNPIQELLTLDERQKILNSQILMSSGKDLQIWMPSAVGGFVLLSTFMKLSPTATL